MESNKFADDNQVFGGSQDTLHRSGNARRPRVEYCRPVSLVAHEAPTTYLQAVRGQESAKRRTAVDGEMDSIRKNKTWRLTDRPASRRVLKGKCVYKVKNEIDKIGNNVTRHKGRVCFMRNQQIKGLDFNVTFSPGGQVHYHPMHPGNHGGARVIATPDGRQDGISHWRP